MTKRNISRKNLRKKKTSPSVDLLKQIRDLQLVQTKGRTPDVPDIPRIQLRRNKVYSFSRTYLAGQIVASTTVDTLGALNFQLSSFVNSSEFTALFDQYRLSYIEVDFIYVNPASVLAPFYTVIDYDDSTTPAAVTDLLQYPTLMHTAPGQEHQRRLSPRFDYAAYSGVFTSFAVSNAGDWVDVASPSVQYYGVKYALPATTGGTAGTVLNINVTGIIQVRNSR